jgi:hypothetical protein
LFLARKPQTLPEKLFNLYGYAVTRIVYGEDVVGVRVNAAEVFE